jgi:Flp pilus assembly pilin Flp
MGKLGQLKVKVLGKLHDRLVKFVKEEDSATAVEYAVMLAPIIAVCVGVIATLGNNPSSTFDYVASKASSKVK